MRTSDEIINYLDQLRKEQGMSISELARRVGMAKSGVSRYFNRTREFPINRAPAFAKALHVSVEELLGVEPFKKEEHSIDSTPQPQSAAKAHNVVSLPQLTIVQIPILGTIACGGPITAEQNVEGYTHELFDEQPTGTLFALRCKGDSMEPLIPDGSIVLIHQQPTVEDGEIAAVLVDDNNEATLKRVKHTGDQIMLIPENKKYDPILLNKENPGRILGKAVHVDFKL